MIVTSFRGVLLIPLSGLRAETGRAASLTDAFVPCARAVLYLCCNVPSFSCTMLAPARAPDTAFAGGVGSVFDVWKAAILCAEQTRSILAYNSKISHFDYGLDHAYVG